ncbi:hypothetical protein ACFX1X_030639 [Malus domestica]
MLEQAFTLGFKASNNEAEYEALLAGLRMAKDLAVKKLVIHSDSQLITSQATGEYMAKHPRMAQYLEKVRQQLEAFHLHSHSSSMGKQRPCRCTSRIRLHPRPPI